MDIQFALPQVLVFTSSSCDVYNVSFVIYEHWLAQIVEVLSDLLDFEYFRPL
jgi:hypothetical protein